MNKYPGTFINFFAGIVRVQNIPSSRMEAVLINVPHVTKYSTSIDNTKALIKKTGAQYVMLDSGGYTVFNTYRKDGSITLSGSKLMISRKGKQIIVSCQNVVDVASKIQPDIVIGLDYPVMTTRNPVIQMEEFDRKKELNLQWMKEMSELCQIYCPHIELYLPIQCYDLDQFAYFEDDLMRLKYDGMALPIRNMNPMEISRFLIRINELGIRKVHLLGTSSFSNIALATYFARNVFERCSIDSTTWSIGVQYHQYIHPYLLTKILVGRTSTAEGSERLPCKCRWCKGKTYGDITNLVDRERREHLKHHNYLAFKNAGEEFSKHARDPHAFESFLRKHAPKRNKDINCIMRAIRMADSRISMAKRKQVPNVA